jgi:hypothetical protein
MLSRKSAGVLLLQTSIQTFDIPASLQSFLNGAQQLISLDTDVHGVGEGLCQLRSSQNGSLQKPIALVLSMSSANFVGLYIGLMSSRQGRNTSSPVARRAMSYWNQLRSHHTIYKPFTKVKMPVDAIFGGIFEHITRPWLLHL